MSNLIRIENLRIGFSLFGRMHEVVKGVNMRIPAGSVAALVGESGSGKSVISQAIMGILPRTGRVTGGHIFFTDPRTRQTLDLVTLERDGAEMRMLRGSQMAMIFQEPMNSLSPLYTIGNQIEEMLVLHSNVRGKEAQAATIEMLRLVGFPQPARAYQMYPFELSGGLRQRAMIAMALICRPSLLIADEPTTALDVTIQAQVLSLLKDLQGELGMSMLLITHDLGVVANIADEVSVIYHGEIMEAGPVDAIFRNAQHPYLKALLHAVPHFDMSEGERLVSLRDDAIDTSALTHRSASEREAASLPASSSPRPLLSVRDLSKSFEVKKGNWLGLSSEPPIRAVNDVGFDVMEGECLGLVGESGCGKSTLSKIVMRALTPDSGSVTYFDDGNPIDVLSLNGQALKAFRRKQQMIFQDPVNSLSPRMTVLSILKEPMQIHNLGSADEQTARAIALMRAVGLDPRFLNRYPHSFSGGQRQRIGIARALALGPKLLICDEPVSALDVSVQAQVLNLLRDLKAELGLTYLFISHNLAVVDYMADRIAVMARGQIVEIAPRHVLFRKPVHPYTQALLGAVPYPDLDRPLDFSKLINGTGSDPTAWPEPFRSDPRGADLTHHDLGEGHIVLATKSVASEALRI